LPIFKNFEVVDLQNIHLRNCDCELRKIEVAELQ